MRSALARHIAAGTTALVGMALLLSAGTAAHAATSPPWEPDPQAAGTISFYNSSGVQITSGSIDDAPIAAYAVGSSTIRKGDARAQLLAAQPNPNTATSGYNVDYISSVTAYPPSTGPADITSEKNPVVTGSSGDITLDDFIGEFPNSGPTGPGCAYETSPGDPSTCTNTAYENLYQFRLKTLNTGGFETATYDVADVLVSGTTWTQVYPGNPTATKPTISGQVRVGVKDTCVEAAASGDTVSYVWKINGKKAATGKTFTVPGSAYKKSLSCAATVSFGSGPKSTATSASHKVALGKALKATKKPKLSGAGRVGKTEKALHGKWTPKASSYSYQWYRGSKKIKGATKSALKLSRSEKGKAISCRVTAHKAGYEHGTAKTKSVKVS